MDFIKIVNEAFATGKSHPSFRSGDTITVDYRISEGGKERIQRYRGVVIRISGHGDKKRFTVRKISEGVGVERIFTLESPCDDIGPETEEVESLDSADLCPHYLLSLLERYDGIVRGTLR